MGETLYERLGGDEGIEAVVDEFHYRRDGGDTVGGICS
jgi:truncated hemoglobin YjbI